jgi:hypothetical protein
MKWETCLEAVRHCLASPVPLHVVALPTLRVVIPLRATAPPALLIADPSALHTVALPMPCQRREKGEVSNGEEKGKGAHESRRRER